MKILLDECVDWRLLRDLERYDARTTKQVGLDHLEDGEVLRRAAATFDVLLTVDKHLPQQQNIAALNISVVVLRGRTTRLSDLRELLEALHDALGGALWARGLNGAKEVRRLSRAIHETLCVLLLLLSQEITQRIDIAAESVGQLSPHFAYLLNNRIFG